MSRKRRKIILSAIAAAVAVMMLFGILTPVLGANAATSQSSLDAKYKSLQKQLSDIEKQIKQNEAKINANNKKEENIKKQKEAIDKKIEITKQQLSVIQEQVNENQRNIDNLNNRIAETQKKIDENFKLYRERVCALYEAGSVSRLQLLLSSKNASEFLSRFEIIKKISEHDNNLINELKQEKEQIEQDKSNLEKEKATLQKKLEEARAKQADLNSQAVQSAKYLEQLHSINKQLENSSDALDDKKAEVEDDLQAAHEELMNFLSSQKSTGSFGGQFIWPVNGAVSCEFRGYSGHTGIDILGKSGVTPVRAAASGTVIKVGKWNKSIPRRSAGYGNYVVIDNGQDKNGNSIRTLYAHMYDNTIRVHVGQHVSQGEIIGTLGNSGNVRSHGVSPAISDLVSGAHLHFEIIVNNHAVNPRNYL